MSLEHGQKTPERLPQKRHTRKKQMENIILYAKFSLNLYLLSMVISAMVMEMVVLIRRFVGLGKGR